MMGVKGGELNLFWLGVMTTLDSHRPTFVQLFACQLQLKCFRTMPIIF